MKKPAQKSPPRGMLPSTPFLWPLLAAASASAATAAFLNDVAHAVARSDDEGAAAAVPGWTTANSVVLELASMRLREFSAKRQGTPTLLCAPYALHGATVADFAPGHSIVETLRGAGLADVFVTDWRSATPDMRYFSIDSYLADLNVAVDELAGPVDLVGLCQGGWLALLYAARFPEKVRRLVLVATPVDIGAAKSPLSRLVTDTPAGAFENLVRFGEGRVLGRHVLETWGAVLGMDEARKVLQLPPDIDVALAHEFEERFRQWYGSTVDLPGTYYLEVIDRLYRDNQIAAGRFMALGHRIDLGRVKIPIFMLAGRDDELVAPQQLLSTARLVGTAKASIETALEPCGHLSLFLGRKTLAGAWRKIGRWLQADLSIAKAS
jgi:poly(3-hydroxyalkanoate) synthetase